MSIQRIRKEYPPEVDRNPWAWHFLQSSLISSCLRILPNYPECHLQPQKGQCCSNFINNTVQWSKQIYLNLGSSESSNTHSIRILIIERWIISIKLMMKNELTPFENKNTSFLKRRSSESSFITNINSLNSYLVYFVR